MPTHQNDSYYQTQRVKQRTIYANYRITQQAFLEGRTIHLPSPSNVDGSVLASLAGGPLQFTPAELTTILQINSTVPLVNSSVPGQPTLSGSPGNERAVLTWTAPSNGGSPITSYTINWIPGSGSRTVTSGTRATITGLTNGTQYSFTVYATNSVGNGLASAPYLITPVVLPTILAVGGGSIPMIVYSTDATTWVAGTGSIPNDCKVIVYGGTTWVAGGDNNGAKLLYSTDNGMTWHDASGDSIPFNGGQCNAIAYNGTKWVAGGGSNEAKLLYSTDGQYWHDASGDSIPFGNNGECNAIAYNGTNKWVAGGYNYTGGGNLLYSSDGQYWHDASGDSIPFNGGYRAIAYNGTNKWVAGGNNGEAELLYSTDGQYWHHASGDSIPFNGGQCNAIAYNGTNKWVAGGYSNVAKLLYSTDGQYWHDASGDSIPFGNNGVCNVIAYNGTTWVAGGGSNGAKLLYSSDGQYWHDASGDSIPFSEEYYRIAYNETTWIAGGYNGIFTSQNGQSWTILTANIRIPNSSRSIAYGGSRWMIIGGYNYSITYSRDNGQTWTAADSNNVLYNYTFAHDGTTWVAGGYNGIAYSTDDGESWTPATGITGACYTIAYNGSTWLAGGENGIFTSSNGQTWTATTGTTLPSYCYTIAYNGSTWLAGGNNGIFTSSNGESWTQRMTSDCIILLYGYGGTRWVAGLNGDGIAYSADNGVNWNYASGTVGTTLPGTCYTLAYNGTTWVAGGGNGIFTSSNGESWTQIETRRCNTLAYNGTTWVAGFDSSGIAYSTNDGQSWTPATGDLPNSCNSVTYDSSGWIAAAYDEYGNQLYYSPNGENWTAATGDTKGYAMFARINTLTSNTFNTFIWC